MSRWSAMLALLIGCGTPGVDEPTSGPTWHGEVGPLVMERCGACHSDRGIGPFSVEDFETAASWGPAMVDAVREGRMPPFAAVRSDECEPNEWYKDDNRLSQEELELLEAWVEAGTPEGDDQGPLPKPGVVDLEAPDAILPLPVPYTVPATGGDIYRCFRVEVPTDTDLYVTGVQVLPDNEKVVHHVLVWTDPLDRSAARVDADGGYPCSGTPDVWPAELLGAWTPGGSPTRSPTGTGSLLKAGASVVVNVHYHPTGESPEVDRTEIALQWTTERPDNYTTWFLVDLPFGAQVQPGPNDEGGPEFRIPAGVSDHVETLVLDTGTYLPWSLPIFAVTPHMHYLGTEMLVRVVRDEEEDECLVHTPNYRFDFQTSYVYDAPQYRLPVVNPGDRLEVRCTYDNSPSNPHLAAALEASGHDAPVDVRWGEETGDEMCMAMIGLIIPPIDLSEFY